MEDTLVVIAIIVIALVIFVIYFILKILEFVILAVNLYKKMVNRLDAMLKLLLDLRDNTKQYESISLISEEIENISSQNDTFICEDCKTVVPSDAKLCPKCGAQFE